MKRAAHWSGEWSGRYQPSTGQPPVCGYTRRDFLSRNGRRRPAAAALSVLIGMSPLSAALAQTDISEPFADVDQDIEAATDESESPAKRGALNILPIPVVNPTVGAGLVAAAIYTFPSPGGRPGTPRSTLGAIAGYADSKSYVAGLSGNLRLDEGRVRLSGLGGYAKANIDYFGLTGVGVDPDDPVALSGRGLVFNVNAQRRLSGNFFAGVAVNLLDFNLSSQIPIDEFGGTKLAYKQFGIGPVARYDSRDSGWWPTQGALLSAKLIFVDASFNKPDIGEQTEINFRQVDAKAAAYQLLAPKLVGAVAVRAAQVSNSAPFFMQPSISVRGFPSGRYYDNFVLEAQGELRWFPLKRIGFVAFAGAGVIASGLGGVGDGNGAVGYGVGARYQLSPVDAMNIGIDVAFGGNNAALYFRLGEAF